MSANKSGNKDFSGVLNASQNRHYETRSQSNQKSFSNKNDGYSSYESATNRKHNRKVQQKPPVVPDNRRVSAARHEQNYIQTQPQVVVTLVAPFTPMDMDLEARLSFPTAPTDSDTSHLRDLIPGKSPEDIMADLQKRAEIQAAVRDALKKQ